MTKNTCKEMVTEFHHLNGSVIDAVDPGPEVAVVRTRLMIEEFAETYIALHQDDVIEAADGLADLLYVIYGTAVAYGVDCPDVFQEPRRAPVETFNRGNVLQFARAGVRVLARVCDVVATTPAASSGALTSLAIEVCAFGAACGFPMRELFEEVQASNMTKTFSPATNTAGGKYGAGVNPKGPGYRPPDIAAVLERARESFARGSTSVHQTGQVRPEGA